MQVIPASGKAEGFFVRVTSDDPALLLPLSAPILSEISRGGCLELDIRAVSLADGVSLLSEELVASGEYIRSLESELFRYREEDGVARIADERRRELEDAGREEAVAARRLVT
jgi:hypothetical protein